MKLSVLSYNIKRGGAGRIERLANVINSQSPDLVVLQEATRPDLVQALATLTRMPTAISMRGRSVACLSRVPISRHRYARPFFSQHAFLEIVPRDARVHIFGVHLSAVHAAWTERRRVRELRSLLSALEQYGDEFRIVVGDFNTLAPNEAFDFTRLPYRLRVLVWLSGGRIRWQTIAIMLGANYADVFRTVGKADSGYTFPTWDPHVRLDYAFVPKAYAERMSSCSVVRDAPDVTEASDHFPLRLEVEC